MSNPRGVVEGGLGGAEPPLLKFPFNQGGLSPFGISAERDIILVNKTNFLPLIKIVIVLLKKYNF